MLNAVTVIPPVSLLSALNHEINGVMTNMDNINMSFSW